MGTRNWEYLSKTADREYVLSIELLGTKEAVKLNDPYYVETGIHFDRLVKEYGAPIIVLNLIKVHYIDTD